MTLLRPEDFKFCNFQVLHLPLLIISVNTGIPKAVLEDRYKGEVLQRKPEGYKAFPGIPVVKGNQQEGKKRHKKEMLAISTCHISEWIRSALTNKNL